MPAAVSQWLRGLIIAGAVMANVPEAQAQRYTTFLDRPLYGGGIDVMTRADADGALPLIGLQLTNLTGHVVLPELDVSLIWLLYAFLASANLGAGVALEDPGHNVLLVLRGGPTLLAGLAPVSAAGSLGYHVGGGLLFRTDESTAIRLDVTRQFFRGDELTSFWKFGFSITELGRPTGSPRPMPTPSCGCRL